MVESFRAERDVVRNMIFGGSIYAQRYGDLGKT
jgi:hypothetical protein